ncbi:hypothetical protein Golomagni_07225 [Golovinomyces magnicellulatus]|nr:hypothetical protein Golomagni_07225 [Golovinomyces magnicellulatus]
MPTNQIYWEGYDDVSDARLVADISVWAATTPSAGNEAFNVANGDTICWQYLWPRLAAPKVGQTQIETSFHDWARDKEVVWERMGDDAGVPGAKKTFEAGTWLFQDWVFQRGWNSTVSINKARKFGWTGHKDSFESFTQTFDRFVELGQVPPFRN